jgi:type II secretory pathway pseudopilin PulG
MRATRIVAALVALILAAALPLLATDSATASSEKQAAAVKKSRNITFQFRAQNKTYRFQGTVKPRNKSKNVTVKLLRATCKNCNYRPFRSATTNNRAKYAFSGLKKTGWFTIKVPASKGYATSYASKSIHVFID